MEYVENVGFNVGLKINKIVKNVFEIPSYLAICWNDSLKQGKQIKNTVLFFIYNQSKFFKFGWLKSDMFVAKVLVKPMGTW